MQENEPDIFIGDDGTIPFSKRKISMKELLHMLMLLADNGMNISGQNNEKISHFARLVAVEALCDLYCDQHKITRIPRRSWTDFSKDENQNIFAALQTGQIMERFNHFI